MLTLQLSLGCIFLLSIFYQPVFCASVPKFDFRSNAELWTEKDYDDYPEVPGIWRLVKIAKVNSEAGQSLGSNKISATDAYLDHLGAIALRNICIKSKKQIKNFVWAHSIKENAVYYYEVESVKQQPSDRAIFQPKILSASIVDLETSTSFTIEFPPEVKNLSFSIVHSDLSFQIVADDEGVWILVKEPFIHDQKVLDSIYESQIKPKIEKLGLSPDIFLDVPLEFPSQINYTEVTTKKNRSVARGKLLNSI